MCNDDFLPFLLQQRFRFGSITEKTDVTAIIACKLALNPGFLQFVYTFLRQPGPCLKMHKRLFGGEAKKVGGDTGYAGTENRDYCKANGIQTSFVKRGRAFSEKKKVTDFVRKELARARATAMEGSFGTQKEHYDLRRVKARTKRTEILYIFFGIHTANVVQLADRIEQRARLAAA